MSISLSKTALLAGLKSRAVALGLSVKDSSDGLSGEMKAIRAKWLLGARTATYRMSYRLEEVGQTAHFREGIKETSWGLAPPSFTTERTAIEGGELSGKRTDRSAGGGGTIEFAKVREALAQTVRD